MGKTLHRKQMRRRTRRTRGGGKCDNPPAPAVAKTLEEKIRSVKAKLESTPINLGESTAMINPTSKFVVATYWWGECNVNRNLQAPCPEDILFKVRSKIVRDNKDTFPPALKAVGDILAKVHKDKKLSDANEKLLEGVKAKWREWEDELFAKAEIKAQVAKDSADMLAAERAANPGNKRYRDRKFPEMIQEWKAYCVEANVNSLALHTEFERSDYQAGINAKPLFILKLLDALKEADPRNPKGVLYIDGDMWVHKYPTLFDIEDVDFMARGWNVDPRAKEKSLKYPYFDPLIFETSGGTMYFGNTTGARRLLDLWAKASEEPKQEGKADDRILSQVFTTRSLVMTTNILQLPIEYLWLTDLQEGFKVPGIPPDFHGIIEHPYCLTGEERAADQGAAANRTPAGYKEEIEEAITYKRPPALLYEYIMFNGHPEMREEMAAYLNYLREAPGYFTGVPMAKIVPFEARYGEFDPIAAANLAVLNPQVPPTGETVSVTTGNIRDILTALRAGKNVWTGPGAAPKPSVPDIECYGADATTKDDDADPYTRFVQIDTTAPMYFSCTSPVLQHLLVMCETLGDMNKHLKKSYMFLSRIRWELVKGGAAAVAAAVPVGVPLEADGATLPRRLHQIWFGGADPGWRKVLFDKNKQICEKYGYEYKLWKEQDRNEDNFPITLDYQKTAIEKGRETGQSRWAQVADLARLEIVYNQGGIYADSIIEISPALLMAIEGAVKGGSRFIGCNEDPCDPFGRGDNPCRGAGGREFLTNSFFAATRENDLLLKLLDSDEGGTLEQIDFDSENINQTTGPYYLRTMVTDPEADKVFLLNSDQMFQYNEQATQSKEVTKDRFIVGKVLPCAVEVKPGQYFLPGGIEVLQRESLALPVGAPLTDAHYNQIVEKKGPVAIYHSGLGGTWSV